MTKTVLHKTVVALLLGLLPGLTTLSLAASPEQEFRRISRLTLEVLTSEAQLLLDRKYPDEDWDAFHFPRYVSTEKSVEVAYKIAVKQTKLLKQFRCHCSCDVFGHADLSWCFLKEGQSEKGFEEHGAYCVICYSQAMRAFLWQEAGVPPEKMREGFENLFNRP